MYEFFLMVVLTLSVVYLRAKSRRYMHLPPAHPRRRREVGLFRFMAVFWIGAMFAWLVGQTSAIGMDISVGVFVVWTAALWAYRMPKEADVVAYEAAHDRVQPMPFNVVPPTALPAPQAALPAVRM